MRRLLQNATNGTATPARSALFSFWFALVEKLIPWLHLTRHLEEVTWSSSQPMILLPPWFSHWGGMWEVIPVLFPITSQLPCALRSDCGQPGCPGLWLAGLREKGSCKKEKQRCLWQSSSSGGDLTFCGWELILPEDERAHGCHCLFLS